MRTQLAAHGPLNTNGAVLPIETGAELQIGPKRPNAVTRRPEVRARHPTLLENLSIDRNRTLILGALIDRKAR